MCRLGACKLQPPDSPHRQRFGAVRSIGTRTSTIPAAWGGRSAHYLSWVGAFIRSLFSLVGRAPAQQAGGHGLESHRRLCMLVQANPMRLHKSRANETRRDDLDSIFQERRRKITLVGKLSKSSRRCFGNVPPWRLQTSASRQPTQAAFWGCQEYRHAHFHHSSSLACKGRGGALHTSYLELEHSSGASLA